MTRDRVTAEEANLLRGRLEVENATLRRHLDKCWCFLSHLAHDEAVPRDVTANAIALLRTQNAPGWKGPQ